MELAEARAVFKEKLAGDEGTYLAYLSQVACVLMDELDVTNKAERNGVAEQVLKALFWEPGEQSPGVPEVMLDKPTKEPDMVNHPPHYQSGSMEVIEVIEAFNLNFHLGNVVKYTLRAGKKADPQVDLEKAKWYLDRMLKRMGGVAEEVVDGSE